MKLLLFSMLMTCTTLLVFIHKQGDGHIFSFQTYYIEIDEGGLQEFDSLMTLVMQHVEAKNKLIKSQHILRHLWGSDSREVIVVREFQTIQDMIEWSESDNTKYFCAFWDTEDKRRDFGEATSKYMGETWHGDEICKEVSGGRIDN